eukprot:TRINITY_DN23912_c0_g2_i1.p1 TRINITY_DN23912_c0_g2~~TRINITY_DN23912_c0_g2_i1.p1  ORF type:complete len:192 (+),score=35.62 TRINITY_DN23912_c0_g2_i1:48-578(+)
MDATRNPFSIVPSLDSTRVTREDLALPCLDVDAFKAALGFGTASAGFEWGDEELPFGREINSEKHSENDFRGFGFGYDAPLNSSQLTFRSHPADPPVDIQHERHCLVRNDVVATVARDHRTLLVFDGDRRPEVLDDGEQRNNTTKKRPYAARLLSAIICTISNKVGKEKKVKDAWM